jgi:uncharacterized coiled-coil protein SlyX
MNRNPALRDRLRRAARRRLAVGAAAALGWGLLAAAAVLVAGAWLDLLWEIPPEGRLAVLAVAGLAGVTLLGVLTARWLARARPPAIARTFDRTLDSGGQVLTGLELETQYPRWGSQGSTHPTTSLLPAPCSPLTAGLGHIASQQAAALAERVVLGRAIPARPLVRALAAVLAAAVVAGLLVALLPELAWTEWRRFAYPYDDVPPYSPLRITVQPGDVERIYGSELEVTAETDAAAEQLELVVEPEGKPAGALPMFPESESRWRAVLARVTEAGRYYVRAGRSRSPRYGIRVLTVPQIEEVRVRLVPPEYARLASYEGALPEEGLRGLRGTRVTLTVTSNRPLAGGRIVLQPVPPAAKRPSPVKRPPPLVLAMAPAAPGSCEAHGTFEITGDGALECRVTDEAGQESQQAVAAGVTLLADQYPFVRIVQPPPLSLATPTAALPVVLSAEDDCGLSRLQLFRSLNESRPGPAEVSVGAPPPRRAERQVRLPLDRYGLAPGDVIKLFARAEDNDPAGAKGAESAIVSVRIIAQEDFERMLRVRRGLEVLTARYREARRRMEGVAKEMDELRKKLRDAPPQSRVAADAREELARLERLLEQDAAALRAAAKTRLPYDLDQRLSPEIEAVAALTEEMAKELEKLKKQTDLLNRDLEKQLAALAQRLAAQQGQFAARAMQPLEHLEAVFPLLVDQSRFVALALRQRDLAGRMASLKGHDGEDDPKLKSRMRDLEHEQAEIRDAVEELLDDIEEHVTRLPDVPELQRLRETAAKFAKDVRASGATEAMRDAEAALEDFHGSRGYEKANEAADILERFIKRCRGEGGLEMLCQGCLVFQPTLASGLGNTIAQLLADMGQGGSGGSGGYGVYGLYGQMGGMFGAGTFGDATQGLGLLGPPRGRRDSQGNPDRDSADSAAAGGGATAAGDAAVPSRYRQRVGRYFQRLAEEIDSSAPTPKRKR